MDTGVRDLKVVFFKANSPDFCYVFYRILSFSAVSQSFKKICVWEIFGRERPQGPWRENFATMIFSETFHHFKRMV